MKQPKPAMSYADVAKSPSQSSKSESNSEKPPRRSNTSSPDLEQAQNGTESAPLIRHTRTHSHHRHRDRSTMRTKSATHDKESAGSHLLPREDKEQMIRTASVEESLHAFSGVVTSDVSLLVEKFKKAYLEHAEHKPNVLVAGCTGAGKSTLVNKMFGKQVATTGTGTPITQHFDRFEDQSVVIYDSKGLEVGAHSSFINTTRSFLEENKELIDVCWYIINSAGSRFQPFEGEVCQQLFADLPIIFILNKADLSSEADRQSLRDSITALGLRNCIAILDTVCTPSLGALKVPDLCPKCGGDDLDVKRKRQLMKCEDCGYEETLKAKTGLEKVVKQTITTLPSLTREHFVAAQRVSIHDKNLSARRLIQDYWDKDGTRARQAHKSLARLLIRLAILWEFREHEHLTKLAKDHLGCYSFRDRLLVLMDQEGKEIAMEQTRIHNVALGIIWNRCVRELYKSLFIESYGTMINAYSDDKLESTLPNLLQTAFEDLNSSTLRNLEMQVNNEGLKKTLNTEFPTALEHDVTVSMEIPFMDDMIEAHGAEPISPPTSAVSPAPIGSASTPESASHASEDDHVLAGTQLPKPDITPEGTAGSRRTHSKHGTHTHSRSTRHRSHKGDKEGDDLHTSSHRPRKNSERERERRGTKTGDSDEGSGGSGGSTGSPNEEQHRSSSTRKKSLKSSAFVVEPPENDASTKNGSTNGSVGKKSKRGHKHGRSHPKRDDE